MLTRRTSQARLITAWWTPVGQNNEDLNVVEATSAVWPEEVGCRIWVSNSSDDAVYECSVFADAKPTDEAINRMAEKDFLGQPYMVIFQDQIIWAVGTLPPKERIPYTLDPSLISSVSQLRVEFRDASGIYWRRVTGTLQELPSDDVTDPAKLFEWRRFLSSPWRRIRG